MSQLLSQTTGKAIAASLKKAQTLKERVQGLIGTELLKEKEAFWIPSCLSVHTFFMAYPIDIVFTDKSFRVISLFENVGSGKIIWGGWKSWHVFEMKSGQIKTLSLKKGEILYVES